MTEETQDCADTVLHDRSDHLTQWTTVNVAEVQPGVLTPLGWTFWRDPCETGLRGAFADTGVLPRSAITPPVRLAERIGGIFYGRFAVNLSLLSVLTDSMPGSSSEMLEKQIFGRVDPTVVRVRSRRRYPIVAATMPANVAQIRRRTRSHRAHSQAWWHECTTDPRTPPRQRLADAQRWLRDAMRLHMFTTLVAQGCYDTLCRLAAQANSPGLEMDLSTGYGGMEESAIRAGLWEVSRGRRSMADFIAQHGYHGPNEGSLSSHSWREQSTQLTQLCDTYRQMPDLDPVHQESSRVAVREAAERRLLKGLPPHRRGPARMALAAARVFLPLREVGKASFLQSIDVGRAAAREIGANLADQGALDDSEDIFYLTVDEILDGRACADWRTLAKQRRALRDSYLDCELPERWTGPPSPVRTTISDHRGALRGVPVCSGIVEGRARVITDPAEANEFGPGDVLVCRTTDPSWVVFFHLASAAVIDVGGPLSHGAIVARELGLPTVINTRTGTERIPDGSWIRVDGSTGLVEILPTVSAPSNH